MQLDRPPYWIWRLDRWILLVAILLGLAALGVGLRGRGAPQIVTPIFLAPAPDTEVLAGSPVELIGLVGAGDAVRFFDGDGLLGEGTADAEGYFRVAVSGLGVGAHRLTAQTHDACGQPLATSAPLPLFVLPALARVVSPTFSSPSTGDILDPVAPGDITGTASPGDTIQIVDGDVVLGQTMAESNGNWRFTLPVLSPGTHTIQAAVSGSDGQPRAKPEPILVTVVELESVVASSAQPTMQPSGIATATLQPSATATATLQPSATATATLQPSATATATLQPSPTATATAQPSIESPPAAVVHGLAPIFAQPLVAAVLLESDLGQATGTAAPGMTIRLVEVERLIGETVADETGNWEVTLSGLSPGRHELIALAIDVEGSQVAASKSLSVEVVRPIEPTFDQLPRTTFTPGVPVIISGSAAPNAIVRITERDVLLGEVVAGPDGRWQFALSDLSSGRHRLEADAVHDDGTVLAALSSLEVVIVAPRSMPSLDAPVAGSRVPTRRPVLSGAAEPGSVVRILDGETFIGETIAGADGRWAFRPSMPLAEGAHDIRVVALVGDEAAPVSSASVVVSVASGPLEPVSPVAGTTSPVLTVPEPGLDGIAPLPTLTGVATPNSIVRIYDGHVLLGETQADNEGNWQFRPVRPLAARKHVLTLIALDEARQETVYSAEVTLGIESVAAVTQPPILSSALPSPSFNSRLSLNGIAGSGSVVCVYDGDTLLGEARADAAGRWYFAPSGPLSVGEHHLRLATVGPDGVKVFATPIAFSISPDAMPIAPPKLKVMYGSEVAPGGFLQGSAPPGSEVQIYDAATFLGAAAVRADGSWIFRLPFDLSEGPHELQAVIATKGGYTLSASPILYTQSAPPLTLPVTGRGAALICRG